MMRTKENMVTVLNIAATNTRRLLNQCRRRKRGEYIQHHLQHKFMGEDVTASGLSASRRFPEHTPCSPSRTAQTPFNPQRPRLIRGPGYQMIQYVAGTGYVVIWLIISGSGRRNRWHHPYLHKESTAQTLVDMLYTHWLSSIRMWQRI